ncbi:MAG: hypothetical protein HY579_08335 [Nitrospinae bacterium]|nr:hypothetical protein [Nitrospinota bacterium]
MEINFSPEFVPGNSAGTGQTRPAANPPSTPQTSSRDPGDKVTLGPDASAVVLKHDHAPEGPCQNCDEARLKGGLTEEELKIVEQLKARDRQVRAHEQAHLSAAGPYAAGGPSFQYETGPDGQQYAVGGEVSIDTSEVKGDPEATIQKAQAIQRAALAPADPSGQDVQVAAQAKAMEARAQQEAAEKRAEETKETKDPGPGQTDPARGEAPEPTGPARMANERHRGQSGLDHPPPGRSPTGSLLDIFA